MSKRIDIEIFVNSFDLQNYGEITMSLGTPAKTDFSKCGCPLHSKSLNVVLNHFVYFLHCKYFYPTVHFLA